jgi:hypothetical protein
VGGRGSPFFLWFGILIFCYLGPHASFLNPFPPRICIVQGLGEVSEFSFYWNLNMFVTEGSLCKIAFFLVEGAQRGRRVNNSPWLGECDFDGLRLHL